MNTSQQKDYAPKARKHFIEAVKARAAKFGIARSAPVEMMMRDDVAVIYGEAYPRPGYPRPGHSYRPLPDSPIPVLRSSQTKVSN